MSDINVGLLYGELAWTQHDGRLIDAPVIRYVIQWVDKYVNENNIYKE